MSGSGGAGQGMISCFPGSWMWVPGGLWARVALDPLGMFPG